MRCIFYHYNYNGSLILDYDGEDFRTTQVYVYYKVVSQRLQTRTQTHRCTKTILGDNHG